MSRMEGEQDQSIPMFLFRIPASLRSSHPLSYTVVFGALPSLVSELSEDTTTRTNRAGLPNNFGRGVARAVYRLVSQSSIATHSPLSR